MVTYLLSPFFGLVRPRFLASSHGGDPTTKLLEKLEDVPLFFPFLVLEDPLGGILNLDLDELVCELYV